MFKRGVPWLICNAANWLKVFESNFTENLQTLLAEF